METLWAAGLQGFIVTINTARSHYSAQRLSFCTLSRDARLLPLDGTTCTRHA
jgi:hypothetical protein